MESKVILVKEDGVYYIDAFVKSKKGDDWIKIDTIVIGSKRNLRILRDAINKELGVKHGPGKPSV